jgi:rhomboid protease GluP
MTTRYKLTYTIIGINIVMYIISAIYSGSLDDLPLDKLLDLGAMNGLLVVLKGEWYRVFVAMFLHGGLMHIAMNMFSLYIVGRVVETYFSKISYLILYFSSGLFGAMLSLYMHPNSVGVGASGAIFGVFGAIIGFFLYHKNRLGTQSNEVLKEFVVILVLNLVLGISISSIDLSAHIGGLFVGIIGGYVISRYPKYNLAFLAVMMMVLFISKSILESHYVQIYF